MGQPIICPLRVRGKSGLGMLGILLVLTLAPGVSLPGCDKNLLTVLRSQLPVMEAARNLLDLAGQADRLADSLDSLPAARTAFSRLEEGWLVVERNWPRNGGAASPVQRAGLAAAVRGLRFSLDQEDLLSAHEGVERVFYATLGLLHAEGFPPPQKALLETALGIEHLMTLAQARRIPELGPRIAALVPALQQVREAFPGVATLSAGNLIALGANLGKSGPAQDIGPEKLLVGVTLMKEEFAVFLRGLAAQLASRQEAR